MTKKVRTDVFELPNAQFPCDPWEDVVINQILLRGSKSVEQFQWTGLQPCAQDRRPQAHGLWWILTAWTEVFHCMLWGKIPWTEEAGLFSFWEFVLKPVHRRNMQECFVWSFEKLAVISNRPISRLLWRSAEGLCLITKFTPPYSHTFFKTHWGLVTPYGDINLGQHWLR